MSATWPVVPITTVVFFNNHSASRTHTRTVRDFWKTRTINIFSVFVIYTFIYTHTHTHTLTGFKTDSHETRIIYIYIRVEEFVLCLQYTRVWYTSFSRVDVYNMWPAGRAESVIIFRARFILVLNVSAGCLMIAVLSRRVLRILSTIPNAYVRNTCRPYRFRNGRKIWRFFSRKLGALSLNKYTTYVRAYPPSGLAVATNGPS